MREKLLELLTREGLRPSQLAEMLEINPAGISHILAGRNKPSFELLQKILRRFPRINPDWLLLDSDQMYRSEIPLTSTRTDRASVPKLAHGITEKEQGLFSDLDKNTDATSPSTNSMNASTSIAPNPEHHKARVQRIVIFYDDQTFDTYTPTLK